MFPAKSRSGHIEQSTLKKQRAKAYKGEAKDDEKTGEKRYDIQPFPLDTPAKGNGACGDGKS